MRIIWWVIAFIGLGLTLIPSLLVFGGMLTVSSHKSLMVIGMLLWFVSASFLLKKKTT
jgi:hypothetical protein